MKYKTWECKIVVPMDAQLPEGFDFPPRLAAMDAVARAGVPVLSCFSGWGGKLTPTQEEVVDEDIARRSNQKLTGAQASGPAAVRVNAGTEEKGGNDEQ